MIELIKANMFPTILILLDIFAGAEKATQGDYKKMGYWIAAAVLTYCVTF